MTLLSLHNPRLIRAATSLVVKKLLLLLFLALAGRLSAQWSSFGTGIAPNVFVIGMVDYQGSLLAYTFPAPMAYQWDGLSQWNTPIPAVPNAGGIHRLTVIDSVLWAATYATGTYNQVHRWDGSQWVQVGRSFRNWGSSAVPSMYDLLSFQDTLYVCGDFARYGTDTINGIAKLVDSIWVPLAGGVTGGLPPYNGLSYPHQMLVFNNELVVLGNFKWADGQVVNGIARWDGTQWHGFGGGFNGAAYGACVHNGELYVGGEFTMADGIPVNCLAKWDGNAWVDPGVGVETVGLPGVHPFIHTLVSHQGRLVLAGGFNRVHLGPNVLNGKGCFIWDGANVDRMAGGVDGDAECIYPYQTGLLIGGDFSQTVNGTAADNVAYYDFITSTFQPINAAFSVYPTQARDRVSVLLPQGTDPDLRYEVQSLLGTTELQGTVHGPIDIASLPTGWHLIRILTSSAVLGTAKFQRVD